jgi:hypothetical protein
VISTFKRFLALASHTLDMVRTSQEGVVMQSSAKNGLQSWLTGWNDKVAIGQPGDLWMEANMVCQAGSSKTPPPYSTAF